MRRFLILSWPAALLLGAVLLATDPPPSSSGNADHNAGEIDALIRQLGDQNFETRQKATEQLLERPEAIPALRRALKSSDAEVVSRAKAILEGLARRRDKRALARLKAYAENGEVDKAIELLVWWPEWAEEEAAWQVMTGLADRLFDLGGKEFGKPAVPERHERFPAGDFRCYVKHARPKIQTTGSKVNSGPNADQTHVVRAVEIDVGFCRADLLVSAGSVVGSRNDTCPNDPSWLLGCAVFAGGSVNIMQVDQGIIVCDGDFTAQIAGGCLIVARGDVRCSAHAGECRIVAGGKVNLPSFAERYNPKAREKEPNPLGFIKWFEPAGVGMVVEPAEGGLRVKQATEGKPFAKAGLRSGDLAVVAEGKPIGSAEDFRRLLRRKVVLEEELTLEVRRDGKPLKLTVPLND